MISRSARVAFIRSEDRYVVLNLDRLTEAPVVIDGTAALVWEGLAEATTVEDLVSDLAGAFDVDPSHIRPDVEALVTQLLGRGLVDSGGVL